MGLGRAWTAWRDLRTAAARRARLELRYHAHTDERMGGADRRGRTLALAARSSHVVALTHRGAHRADGGGHRPASGGARARDHPLGDRPVLDDRGRAGAVRLAHSAAHGAPIALDCYTHAVRRRRDRDLSLPTDHLLHLTCWCLGYHPGCRESRALALGEPAFEPRLPRDAL